MAQAIELGLDTFGDIQAGTNGQALSHAQVIRNVIEESALADEVGVHCIGLGEHHRPDFAISSPEVLLGAIASRTTRIHLASSVTVLSSDDPIRVFQRFSTVNAISKRARRGDPRPRFFHGVISVVRLRFIELRNTV
jgi:alkanesulfonate monooxygenase SsuD/methylene tetrahydromethanopterin reductase-like flavin-dependent oxidoreductase (luciferase family)